MKKTFALLLALVMTLSLAACGGGSDDKAPTGGGDKTSTTAQQQQTTPTPDASAPDDKGGDVAGLDGYLATRTGKFYSQFADGQIYMEYEMDVEGQTISVVSATDGDKNCSETKMNGVSMGVSLLLGTDMYTIDHASKMVIKTSLNADAQTIAGTVIDESDVDMGDLKTGTREIDGKTYDTEEWIVEGAASIMCFDGDDLAYIVGVFEGEEMVMRVVEVSDKVDSSLFEIPADYTVMDMSGGM